MFSDTYLLILILAQFETDYVVHSDLTMSEDLLNTKYKDKLEPSYKVIDFISFFLSVFLCFYFLGKNIQNPLCVFPENTEPPCGFEYNS